MPIARANGKIVFFAHIPKCGGTSVEKYLRSRTSGPAFRDSSARGGEIGEHWSRSSPQHIEASSLAKLFPQDFFDAQFALVRHPIDRMVSVFNHQRKRNPTSFEQSSFGEWLAEVTEKRVREPYFLDNHLRPQWEFVPAGSCAVFKLEDGMEAVATFIHEQLHLAPPIGPIGHKNAGSSGASVAELTEEERQQIYAIYRRDFETFGYALAEVTPNSHKKPAVGWRSLFSR